MVRKKSLYKLVKEAGSRVMAEERENLAGGCGSAARLSVITNDISLLSIGK